eukprot:TRINITY_DN13681_c0_g1_i1.p1 TRINITY_DN13681_c0_g1~~TRINITY_DN13681_c0_g1_i1.p1  ORF type:complete len:168 (+),score=20.58 TRINITY_DN13681_c0_g1_i1:3-506(+)
MDALERIQSVRGSVAFQRSCCFSTLQGTLRAVRRELEKLHREEMNRRCCTDAQIDGEDAVELEGSNIDPFVGDVTSASSDESTIAKQLLDRELRFLELRDARLLFRLQRMVNKGRRYDEVQRRKVKAAQEAETRRRQEKRRRSLLFWDPNETMDDTKRRLAQVAQDI